MPKSGLEQHYSPEQVAERLQVTKRTVLKWINEEPKRIRKVVLIGPKVMRIPQSEIDHLLSQQTVEAR